MTEEAKLAVPETENAGKISQKLFSKLEGAEFDCEFLRYRVMHSVSCQGLGACNRRGVRLDAPGATLKVTITERITRHAVHLSEN
jgi:hypothetical protein